jgi:hypothetical protein
MAIWLLVFAATIIMAMTLPFGNDAKVYKKTIEEVRSGVSPYLEGIARLELNHTLNRRERTMNYIYPPMTLPLARAIGWTPAWLYISVFWLLYAASAWLLLWTEGHFLYQGEMNVFRWLAPLCLFFPGLLNDDFLLAGNIAPVLYGIICIAAIWDWRRHQWKWFYPAVLIAFIFKAPMITLLAIPVLTKTREWLRATVVGSICCLLMLLQGWLWPVALHQYLKMMVLEFSYNREFGFGPAGMLGKALLDRGLPYLTSCAIFYLLFSSAIFLLLFHYSRHYLAGRLSAHEWIPVLLVGVILLNPRIKQYDAEAVTLPMAILAWRALRGQKNRKKLAVAMALALLAVGNILAALANGYDFVEVLLMLTLFAYSVWGLHQSVACVDEVIEAVPEPQLVSG